MKINDVVVITKPAALIAIINYCSEDFVGYIGLVEEVDKNDNTCLIKISDEPSIYCIDQNLVEIIDNLGNQIEENIFDKFQDEISIPDHDQNFRTKPKTTQKQYEKRFGYKRACSLYHPIVINWSERGRGFGSYVFYQKDGKIYCDNEGDRVETVKRILCKMVDQSTFIG